MLKFNTVEIGHHAALFNIPSLSLEPGKCYSIIAPNGAGKTTFLLTLLRQYSLLKGDVLLNDRNLSLYNASELAKEIGFVASRFEGVEHMSVFDYVALGRSPYTNIFGYLSSTDNDIIDTSLAKLNITEYSNTDTSILSDGMRQLCAIAKVLAQKTRIILLDEPTAFLDYANKTKVMQLLKELAKSENLIVLLSSHDIELSAQFEFEFLFLDKVNSSLTLETGISYKSVIDRVF
jgi:iron complex transport system ATP-binding protein